MSTATGRPDFLPRNSRLLRRLLGHCLGRHLKRFDEGSGVGVLAEIDNLPALEREDVGPVAFNRPIRGFGLRAFVPQDDDGSPWAMNSRGANS